MNFIPFLCRASIRAHSNKLPVILTNSKRLFSTSNISMAQHKITHVIFDFDGVILDTETVFYEANSHCFEHFGLKYSRQLKQGQMGRPLTEGVAWLMENTDLSKKGVSNEEYIKFYHETVDKMLDNLKEMPGAWNLIKHLSSKKIPLAICTGSGAYDDPEVKHGKPAPDPYLVTMKRFPTPPENPKNVLVFEDSVNGVYSSLAAGCTTCMIPQEQFKPNNWEEIYDKIKPPKTADILNSLEKLDLSKYGLPPF